MAFELPLLDGTKFVRLADFSGRPVLLNFWGSDCPPCVKELPLLVASAKRYPALAVPGHRGRRAGQRRRASWRGCQPAIRS